MTIGETLQEIAHAAGVALVGGPAGDAVRRAYAGGIATAAGLVAASEERIAVEALTRLVLEVKDPVRLQRESERIVLDFAPAFACTEGQVRRAFLRGFIATLRSLAT